MAKRDKCKECYFEAITSENILHNTSLSEDNTNINRAKKAFFFLVFFTFQVCAAAGAPAKYGITSL